MQKEIQITFYNKGLRSYIEIDLCSECPRNDNKGCCGYYSPVFYSSDLAYILKNKPDLLEYILGLEDITILDASITVNNSIDGSSYRCHFHSKDKGCLLPQDLRESVCRHFVCPGIKWEQEKTLQNWKDFFTKLSDFEISLNNCIASILQQKGLSLRNENKREELFKELLQLYDKKTHCLPAFFSRYPKYEAKKLVCEIKYGKDWPL
ncbi:MAG: hypothetical protein H5T98_08470 [Syntrophomonadaceae bacterium]|nr:hypothetical protein [Syntrophomonadaceae bacterium]